MITSHLGLGRLITTSQCTTWAQLQTSSGGLLSIVFADDRGADFTGIFPAKRIVDVESYQENTDAMNAEITKPDELRRDEPDAFIYQA